MPAHLRPIPKCGDDFARNKLCLLGWAMDYIREATDDLERCSVDGYGRIPEPDVRAEVRGCRKWLALAAKEIHRGTA